MGLELGLCSHTLSRRKGRGATIVAALGHRPAGQACTPPGSCTPTNEKHYSYSELCLFSLLQLAPHPLRTDEHRILVPALKELTVCRAHDSK